MSNYDYLVEISDAAKCSREANRLAFEMIVGLEDNEVAMDRFHKGEVLFTNPMVCDRSGGGITLQVICAPQDVLKRMWEANNERLGRAV